MAKKIIVEHRNSGCMSGCLKFFVALIVLAILVYALSIVGCVLAGVGLWFLMRYVWRALVRERPDSGFVKWGLGLAPIMRKVIAGVVSAIVMIALIAAVGSGSNSNHNNQSSSGGQTTQEQTQQKDDGQEQSDGKDDESTSSQDSSSDSQTTSSSSDENATPAPETTTPEPQAELFADNTAINGMLNSYNKANPDDQIQPGEFVAQVHLHSDTIDMAEADRNGFHIFVSSQDGRWVEIDGRSEETSTADAMKAETARWLHSMNSAATDDEINAAWDAAMNDVTQDATIEDGAFKGFEIEIKNNYRGDGIDKVDIRK